MSIVNAKEIMVEALKGGYAIGAFNITDLLQFEAVIDAAVEKKAPVIVQTPVKPADSPRMKIRHVSVGLVAAKASGSGVRSRPGGKKRRVKSGLAT